MVAAGVLLRESPSAAAEREPENRRRGSKATAFFSALEKDGALWRWSPSRQAACSPSRRVGGTSDLSILPPRSER